MIDIAEIQRFVARRKVAFIASVDEAGFPNLKAMLPPRKRDGLREFYFSTNTSSMRVMQYRENPKACIYLYRKVTCESRTV
jgi:general stress protein 26